MYKWGYFKNAATLLLWFGQLKRKEPSCKTKFLLSLPLKNVLCAKPPTIIAFCSPLDWGKHIYGKEFQASYVLGAASLWLLRYVHLIAVKWQRAGLSSYLYFVYYILPFLPCFCLEATTVNTPLCSLSLLSSYKLKSGCPFGLSQSLEKEGLAKSLGPMLGDAHSTDWCQMGRQLPSNWNDEEKISREWRLLVNSEDCKKCKCKQLDIQNIF